MGSRLDSAGSERPRAVSEYLIERMLLAGVDKFCFVISPGKSDILEYYGGRIEGADVCYVVQSRPAGLCDALFCASPLISAADFLLVGLPDTIWFPADALTRLPSATLSFLLFPVCHPELFDAVVMDEADSSPAESSPARSSNVRAIHVKQPDAATRWVWGAFGLPGHVYHELHQLWRERTPRDEYLGTLVNSWLERGGRAVGVRAGEVYVDVGTVHGYREALQALDWANQRDTSETNHDSGRLTHTGTDPHQGSGTRLVVP